MEPRALQLVKCCPSESPILDIPSLNYCLRNSKVGDTPVCLITILGEQRTGKSFLLNQMLLALKAMESGQDSWRPQGGEDLQGFEWGGGSDAITRGVWIWSHPFLLEKKGEKVAVFLLDTEGFMAPDQSKENTVKLLALTTLLSSHQILSVSKRLKEPDLEYLEMFLHVAETIGKHCEMEAVQVRCSPPPLAAIFHDPSPPSPIRCSAPSQFPLLPLALRSLKGKGEVTLVARRMHRIHCPSIPSLQKEFYRHPKVQETLRGSQTRYYLLPFPGKKMMTKVGGNTAGNTLPGPRCHDILTQTLIHPPTPPFSNPTPFPRPDPIFPSETSTPRLRRTPLSQPGPGLAIQVFTCLSPPDMDAEFCSYLETYVTDVLASAIHHTKRSQKGLLTGSQLATVIEELYNLMKHEKSGFSSPDEMATYLHKWKLQKDKNEKFKEVLEEENEITKPLFSAFHVSQNNTQGLLAEEKDCFSDSCSEAYRGQDQSRATETLKEAFRAEEAFSSDYCKHFCGLTAAGDKVAGTGVLTPVGGEVGPDTATAVMAAEATELLAAETGVRIVVGVEEGHSNGKAVQKSEEDTAPLLQGEK
ncbi:RING finger protein 112-like [Ornithorhynchus anatinus]|uniref:RING finger protein 112-like n=1 Tax=Ornithorhynchus anatinus TaxID=9258 RepID=UPI0019D498C3|nr:RING finger protein 112-like [Ornithorhynchus anatinus]